MITTLTITRLLHSINRNKYLLQEGAFLMPRKRTVITEEYKKIFPTRLRLTMALQEKTQQEVAQALGKTRQAVSYYMDGSSSPDWETLSKLAQYFGVSADWLLGLSDTQSTDADIQMVCEYTGLSEEVITDLHSRNMKHGPRDNEAVNFIDKILSCFKTNDTLLSLWLSNRYAALTKEIISSVSKQLDNEHIQDGFACFEAGTEITQTFSSISKQSNIKSYQLDIDSMYTDTEIEQTFYEYRRWRFEAIDGFTKIIDDILTPYHDLGNLVSETMEKIDSICRQTENQNEQDTSPEAERSAPHGND
jgi:DNA-binding XRE family transcriptional regulator